MVTRIQEIIKKKGGKIEKERERESYLYQFKGRAYSYGD